MPTMSKYLVLYRSEAALSGMSVSEMMANTPSEQMAAGMAAWHAWSEKSGKAIVDLGAPLDKSMVIAGETVSPEKSALTGYSLLEAASPEEAAELMKSHPHFHGPGASIQILECVAMPGI
jgi:hypothetical protein